jgi:hypothetical protein
MGKNSKVKGTKVTLRQKKLAIREKLYAIFGKNRSPRMKWDRPRRMKWDRPSLITLVYSLFTILYTLYIAHHDAGTIKAASTPGKAAHAADKGSAWFYFIEFLLVDVYIYYILQGLVRRSKNWDVVLLLPLAIWVATISFGFLVVAVFRIGGFNNKDRYNIDRILLSLVFLSFSLYAEKWIKPRKAPRNASRKPSRKSPGSPG